MDCLGLNDENSNYSAVGYWLLAVGLERAD